MSSHEEEKPAGLWHKFLAPFLVIAAILYVGIYASDVYEYFHHGGPDSLLSAIRETTQRQLDDLKKVDAKALTDVFVRTVEHTTCTWLFQCTPPPPVVHAPPTRWNPAEGLQHYMDHVPEPEGPRLLYHPGWIIYLPSAQLIKGTPHALKETAGEIADAGGWAIAMFLSCTVLWLAAIWLVAKDGKGALIAYLMFVGSLLAISVMVTVVQAVSEFLLEKVGSAVGLLVVVAAQSSALVLLVGLPHIIETPHTVKKALSVYRRRTS